MTISRAQRPRELSGHSMGLLLDCGSHSSSLARGIPSHRTIAAQASTLEAAPGRYFAVCRKKRSAPVLTLAIPNGIAELSDHQTLRFRGAGSAFDVASGF